MKNMKRLFLIYLASLLGFTGLASTPAQAQQFQAQVRPDLYVVMFRADWCPPCKVVEPRLENVLANLGDPGIEYITIDITTPLASEASAHRAFDRNIVYHYNRWLGVTGFAAIIDATTKKSLGCVNMQYSPQDMATHINNLKTYALADQPTQDVTCPAPNQ